MQTYNRFFYFTITQLFGNGVHLGAHVTKRHTNMVRYILTIKSLTSFDIINLRYTLPFLKLSFNFLHNIIAKRGLLLVVNDNIEFSQHLRDNWLHIGQPVSYSHWVGGTMSNFRFILRKATKTYYLKAKLASRISRLAKAQGKVSYKLNNKVQASFNIELFLKQMLRRIRHLFSIPHAVFITDSMLSSIAIKEANVVSIPLIGVVDSTSDIFKLTYPIPGNTQSVSAVFFYYKLIKLVVLKGFLTEQSFFLKQITHKFINMEFKPRFLIKKSTSLLKILNKAAVRLKKSKSDRKNFNKKVYFSAQSLKK